MLMPSGSLLVRVASYAALLFGLGAVLYSAWDFRLLPPGGTDGLVYHLTLPAHWLREGYLAPVDLPFHDGACEHSPALMETIFYLLIRLVGDDRSVWLVQPVFFVATCRLYYLSVRSCGLTADVGRFATAAVVLFPAFGASIVLANADLVITFGAALFCYGTLSQRLRPAGGVLTAAAGIAVLLASKYIGVVYVAAAVPVLVASVVLRGRPSGGWRFGTYASAAGIAAAGGVFHLRNWVTLGNPLFPAEVDLGGYRLFPGLYRSSDLIDHAWSREAVSGLLVHSYSPFGVLWPLSLVLWVGPFAILAARLMRKLRRRDADAVLVGLVFPALSVPLYLIVNPFWREHRLLFPAYYALLFCTGFGVGLLRRYGVTARARGVIAAALFAGYFGVQLTTFFPVHLLPAGCVGAVAGAVLGLLTFWKRPGRRARVATAAAAAAAVSVVLAMPADGRRCRLRGAYFAALYGPQGAAWELVDSLTVVRGVTVAYTGTALTYPLFGCELQNRVVYVPVGRGDRPVPVQLRPGDQLSRRLDEARRGSPDRSYWLEGLRRKGVELLLIVEQAEEATPELEFVARSPGAFRRLLSRDHVSLFRVRGEALPPAPVRE
jgi:hypothetical protein